MCGAAEFERRGCVSTGISFFYFRREDPEESELGASDFKNERGLRLFGRVEKPDLRFLHLGTNRRLSRHRVIGSELVWKVSVY